ncbi:periplasmic binding protein-like II [Hypoxylon rubiginosum]|uniref:Periplasmic binding protein-like II n=1 Tax=Hypoxylon rubiginosum TaxID=110542 RepID=A0ACC0CMM0_9PEZI|nr:periplasmic binding protein-like II [Hypoxylon rubiginosum]
MTVSKPNGSNSDKGKLTRFHVSATGHSLNYLPEYIATRHGFFKEQGIEVTVSVPKPWDLVLDELADGTAAAALGGIWVPSMYRDRVKEYTVFAQLSNRCPLALIARGPVDGFKLTDLLGKTVLMKSGNGASVGLFFKMLLHENGVDPKSVDYVQDLDGIMLGQLFQGGMGDYFLIDNVSARTMAKRNPDISVVMEMVTDGEDIPWSVYYRETASTTPAVVDAEERFCVALKKGMEWVMQHDAETYRDELAEIFPAAPVDVLVDLTNVFRRDNMWTSPLVSRHGFDRWQKGIADGRLVTEPLVYETIVNSGPAMAIKK